MSINYIIYCILISNFARYFYVEYFLPRKFSRNKETHLQPRGKELSKILLIFSNIILLKLLLDSKLSLNGIV